MPYLNGVVKYMREEATIGKMVMRRAKRVTGISAALQAKKLYDPAVSRTELKAVASKAIRCLALKFGCDDAFSADLIFVPFDILHIVGRSAVFSYFETNITMGLNYDLQRVVYYAINDNTFTYNLWLDFEGRTQTFPVVANFLFYTNKVNVYYAEAFIDKVSLRRQAALAALDI